MIMNKKILLHYNNVAGFFLYLRRIRWHYK